MEARDAIRTNPWLHACPSAPEIFHQVMPRVHTLMAPFVETLCRQALHQHARTSVGGRLSDVERKNVESMADRFGPERRPLQRFIGWADWDDALVRQEWRHQVAHPLGHNEGVLVCDPSACAQSGPASVGVARQWCGRLGQVDTCHGARSLGYVAAQGHTRVARRLSLPQEWTQDTARLDKAGGPTARRGYRTRHQLALELRAQPGATLPHRWMAGDDAMGRPSWCRRRRAGWGER